MPTQIAPSRGRAEERDDDVDVVGQARGHPIARRTPSAASAFAARFAARSSSP